MLQAMTDTTAPGRTCPLHYHYGPAVFRQPPAPDLAALDVLDPDDPFGHVERVLAEMGPGGAVGEALRLANDDRATDDITVVVVRRDA